MEALTIANRAQILEADLRSWGHCNSSIPPFIRIPNVTIQFLTVNDQFNLQICQLSQFVADILDLDHACFANWYEIKMVLI